MARRQAGVQGQSPWRGSRFLADKELLGLQDHFFVHEGQPYMAIVLTYRSGTAAGIVTARRGTKEPRREPWRDLLEPAQVPLFNTLREWRGQRARAEGIPPYVICTNHQLAQVVRARPQTLGKLGEVEGFGKAKLEKFGAEILAYLRAGPEPAPKPPEKEDHDG